MNTSTAAATTSTDATAIRPFTVAVPQAELDDLHARLDRTRWTDEIAGSEGVYGLPLAKVQALAAHWRAFDWRAFEARLNAFPQFTTEIDGQQVHFIHVRATAPSGEASGKPALILTHGWPGTVLEYLEVIEPLTAAGHDVVVPSIPGFGFSGPTTERGWDTARVARAWVELMRRLGYDRYGAVGNDGGSMISPEVGRLDPEHCVGVHVTQLFSFPSGDPAEMADLTQDEQAALAHLQWFWENLGAFNTYQSQSPQTLAFALADSPVGLLAWNGQLLADQDEDFVIGNVAISWLTRTSGSSMRFYFENAKSEYRPTEPTTTPTALSSWANDFQSIRRFAERDHSDIRQWKLRDGGSHYAAHTDSADIAGDIVEFYGSI